jgi:hypothetical protein
VKLVAKQMVLRLTTVPESQQQVERELVGLGVPWTTWRANQRWPGGEREVLEVELLLPQPGRSAWGLVERLQQQGVWLVARMDACTPLT